MSKNPFSDHLAVVDLETLAADGAAPILSLGLTVGRYDDTTQTFESLVENGLYLKFNLKEQLQKGRKPSERVVKWWYDQSVEARKVLSPSPDNEVSLYDIKSYLTNFFNAKGLDIKKVDFYDRNCFDLSKLQYLVEEDLKEDVFWNYHQTFDIPTAFRFMGFDRYASIRVSDFPGAVYHNALHDAAVDHMRLYKCLHSA
jgi:hypothetical protein